MGEATSKKVPRPNHMCVNNTPVTYHPEWNLYVKHEELCCPSGPHFSKCRGVYKHIAARPEKIIGCLDTSHSQGGWATAQACRLLDRECLVYYPETKKMREEGLGPHPQQREASALGAQLVPLPAGRSAILYHAARKHLGNLIGHSYMMPNALKLPEMITETVDEFERTELPDVSTILVSASSATIAAGVILAAEVLGWHGTIIVHMGYSRSEEAVLRYIHKMTGVGRLRKVDIRIVDEGYAYADVARPGPVPPFPSNEFYDLKCFRWWLSIGKSTYKKALMWNIG